jgi:hypothetical protein
VGGSRSLNSPKAQYGWVWTPGGTTVPVLPTKAYPRSYAIDINDAGTVVGKSYSGDWGGSSNCKPMVWLNGSYSTPIDLDADPKKAVYLPGWTLRQARAVSNPDPVTGIYYVACYGQYLQNGATVVQAGAVVKMRGAAFEAAVPLQSVASDAVKPFYNNVNVNNRGQVCGTNSSQSATLPGTYSCLWNAEDGQITFSRKGDANISQINDNGTIAGEMQSPNGRRVYISDSPYSTFDFLSTQLSGTDANSQTIPYGMNIGYEVVGQAVYPSNLARIAAYWKVQTDALTGLPVRDGDGNLLYTYYDLARTTITGTSVVRSFWLAAGINDSGWITVEANENSTTRRAVVLIPN